MTDRKPTELPPDVTEADLKWPKYEDQLNYRDVEAMGLPSSQQLLFYRTKEGWKLTTLLISKGKGNQPDRYYAIGVTDGKLWRVGRGPHVTDEVVVYVSKLNVERLKKYVDLYVKGLEMAGGVRDRLSSRRAQGQQYRAEGKTHWYR